MEERGRLESLLVPVLTGLLAALLQIVTLLSLMLGRYWRAALYNPVVSAASFVRCGFRFWRCCCWWACCWGRISVRSWPC